MAIGERIHYIRTLRGMTQKYLGMKVGFPEKSADVRMAQYETGTRTPKEEITNMIAEELDVAPAALNVPDIDSYTGFMHTLFALEDIYGLHIDDLDGEICLRLDRSNGSYQSLWNLFNAWQKQRKALQNGNISKEEYDQWRYRYPELDAGSRHAALPSQGLSDLITEELKK